MVIEKQLGRRLKKLRTQAGLSQADLAKAARLDAQTLSRYERGVNTPSIDSLDRMARAMRLPITAFFADEADVPDLSADVLKVVQLLEEQDRDTVRRVYRALKALLV